MVVDKATVRLFTAFELEHDSSISSSHSKPLVLCATMCQSVRVFRLNLFFVGCKVALEPSRLAVAFEYQ